jgi:hypothetical protein
LVVYKDETKEATNILSESAKIVSEEPIIYLLLIVAVSIVALYYVFWTTTLRLLWTTVEPKEQQDGSSVHAELNYSNLWCTLIGFHLWSLFFIIALVENT